MTLNLCNLYSTPSWKKELPVLSVDIRISKMLYWLQLGISHTYSVENVTEWEYFQYKTYQPSIDAQ